MHLGLAPSHKLGAYAASEQSQETFRERGHREEDRRINLHLLQKTGHIASIPMSRFPAAQLQLGKGSAMHCQRTANSHGVWGEADGAPSKIDGNETFVSAGGSQEAMVPIDAFRLRFRGQSFARPQSYSARL